jgi:hypothetical protein
MRLNFSNQDTIAVKEDELASAKVDSGRIVPVSKVSKVNSALIQANKYFIAYPTSKRGVIRIVTQEDASHVTLDACSNFGDITHMTLCQVGKESVFAASYFQGVLVWDLPNDKLKPESVSSPKHIQLEKGNVVSALKFRPGTRELVVGCDNEVQDHEICVISVAGKEVVLAKAQLKSPAVDFDFSPEDENIIVILTKDGKTYQWDRKSNNVRLRSIYPTYTAALSVKYFGKHVIMVLDRTVIVSHLSGIAFNTLELPCSIRKVCYLDNCMIIADDKNNLIFISLSMAGSLEFVTSLNTGLDLLDVSVTGNLEHLAGVAFDVYMFHSSGVSILSVNNTEVVDPIFGESSKTVDANGTKKQQQTKSPTKVKSESRTKDKGKALDRNGQKTPKPFSSPNLASPKPEESLLDSYSRSDFKERSYSLQELLKSGNFVSRQMFEDMQKAHRQEIKRLEQKVDGLKDLMKKELRQANLEPPKRSRFKPEPMEDNIVRKQDSPKLSPEVSVASVIGASVASVNGDYEEDTHSDVRFEPAAVDISLETPFIAAADQQVEPEPIPVPEITDNDQRETQDEKVESAMETQDEMVESAIENLAQLAASASASPANAQLLRSKILEFVGAFDYNQVLPNSPHVYRRQILILTAIACISVGVDQQLLPRVLGCLSALADQVTPHIPEFENDPGFLVSVLNQVNANIKAISSGHPSATDIVSKLRSIIYATY